MKYRQPSKLPVLSWKDVVKVLQKLGYQYKHGKGSHMYFSDGVHNVTVPRHDEIAPRTLLSIIEQAGLTKDQFLKLV
ncbi:type II toxin-antitoxin system HicA family toxin [Nitrososphaera viennensis]|uniref:YcfA family protein n=2 Tax=Nitrososphaera viennensis TaxID=1034015 RepID=A0A060HTD0_9ARCH|nr:type II toxin-antitoxin system HicA family toxin [Nitrososphaera viennensis]AIC16382.1 YcfA family protein [Nitrososphaera viennensis EN76]UVS68318.1 type II toxin-antitoxin system HicA family toxin [Nitrososphaera viennensis]